MRSSTDSAIVIAPHMSKKLEALLEKERKLKAQIQKAKATERTLERKRQTRRKVLIGAAVLAKVEAGLWPKEDLLAMMDGFLTRPHERDLFDLDGDGGAGDAEATQQPDKKMVSNKKQASTQKQEAHRLPESKPGSGFDNDDFDL